MDREDFGQEQVDTFAIKNERIEAHMYAPILVGDPSHSHIEQGRAVGRQQLVRHFPADVGHFRLGLRRRQMADVNWLDREPNLAIQDAVAAARLLAGPLARGMPSDDDLAAVQRRRQWPARVTQRLQLLVQERVIRAVLAGSGELGAPLPVRLLARLPWLQRLPARLIGLGVRPEHIA